MELKDLECRIVDKEIARQFITRYHYSHLCPVVILAVGEYYKDELIHCIVFNYPVGRNMSSEIWNEGNNTNTIELTRMVTNKPIKNLETFSISRALKVLHEVMPNIKIVISYADDEMGHHGYSYQASNFTYYGTSNPHNKWYIDGIRIHEKTIFNRYGTNSVDKLQEILGTNKDGVNRLQIVRGTCKHRYYILLPKDKREKKELLKKIKVKSLPYPKGDNSNYDINKMSDYRTLDNSDETELGTLELHERVSLF